MFRLLWTTIIRKSFRIKFVSLSAFEKTQIKFLNNFFLLSINFYFWKYFDSSIFFPSHNNCYETALDIDSIMCFIPLEKNINQRDNMVKISPIISKWNAFQSSTFIWLRKRFFICIQIQSKRRLLLNRFAFRWMSKEILRTWRIENLPRIFKLWTFFGLFIQ